MSSNHSQKVILVTGTSSGFGLLIAARLASKGHFVYATMRNLTKQQALLDESQKRGGQVLVRALDVTKPQTITAVLEEIKSHHGHIDIVVNNAGYGLGGFFEDLIEDEIRSQMETNFFGVQNVCRQVLPLMREQKQGLIINISSVAGQSATPSLGAYAASKWALEAFSESLYHEVASFGIKVVIVEPGSYPTKIFGENAHYAKGFNDPKSPYYEMSTALKKMIDSHINHSTRNPEQVAVLVEKITESKKPNLRYVSDFSSWYQMIIRKYLPAPIYGYFFRRMIYGK